MFSCEAPKKSFVDSKTNLTFHQHEGEVMMTELSILGELVLQDQMARAIEGYFVLKGRTLKQLCISAYGLQFSGQ